MKWKGIKASKYQTTADLATMHLKDKKVLAADVIKLTRNTYELLEQRNELLEALKISSAELSDNRNAMLMQNEHGNRLAIEAAEIVIKQNDQLIKKIEG